MARKRLTVQFAKSVKGSGYGLSVCGLLCGGSPRRFDDPGRTFFCSELVAEAYKQMGLLPKVSCTPRFVPGDFGEGRCHRLGLLEGARFGKEIRIMFPGEWAGVAGAVAYVMGEV